MKNKKIIRKSHNNYKNHYNSNLCPNAILRSDPGKTTVIESNCLTTNIARPKLITWDEIDFPQDWLIEAAVQPTAIINKNVENIIQTPDGQVQVSFAPEIFPIWDKDR